MKPKVIVLDLDGTLLNSKKQISKRNMLALQKVKRIGCFYLRLLSIGRP
ncbi:HAD family hydrolase [Brevibacillus sp. NPDC003359]